MIPTWTDLANVGLIMMVWFAGLMCGWFLWGKKQSL